jgi:hypothetical protein
MLVWPAIEPHLLRVEMANRGAASNCHLNTFYLIATPGS